MRRSKKKGRSDLARSGATAQDGGYKVNYHRAFDLAQIMVRELGGAILRVSEGLCRLYGYTAAEMVGRNAQELLATEFPTRLDDIDATLLREGQWTGELKRTRRDGSEIWVSSHCALQKYKDGRTAYVVEVNNDISPQKQAEAALSRSEAQLRRLVDSAPVALAMFDGDMRYLAISDRFRKDFNMGDGELIGRCHYDLFPEIPERWKQVHRRCLAGATERDLEDSFDRLTGQRQWIRWETRPWFTPERTVGGLIIYSEDITDWKLAEQEVRATAAHLRMAHEASRSGAWTWDLSTGRSVFSDELWSLFGLEPNAGDANFEALRPSIHPDDVPRIGQAVREALGKSAELTVEWRVRAAGAERWLMSRGRPVVDADGIAVRYAGIIVDITDRKQAEQAANEGEATLRGLLDATRESVWVFAPDGRYLMANETALERLGRRIEDIIGKTPADLLPADLAESRNRQVEIAVRENRPVEFEDERDGIYFRHWLYPVADASGAVQRVVSFSRDVTVERKAERELREQQERLSLAQRAGRSGVFDWNPKTGIGIWTPELEDLFDLPRSNGEYRYEDWLRMVHPDDLIWLKRFSQEWWASGRDTARWEYRHVRADGEVMWLEAVARVLGRDELGSPTRIIGTNQDITERKRDQKALEENAERLRLAIEGARLGTFDFQYGSEEVIWNDRSRELFGMAEDQDLTRSQAQQRVHPEDRDTLRTAMEKALQPDSSGKYSSEFRIVRPDGSVRHVAAIGRVLYEGKGQKRRPVRMTGIYLDITEQKSAETALRKSEAKMRAVFGALSEGVIFSNTDGVLEQMNPAMEAIAGCDREGMLDPERDPRRTAIHSDGTPFRRDDLPSMVALRTGNGVRNVEMGAWKPTGELTWMSINAQPVRDDDGNLLGVVASLIDITERKRADEAVRQSEEQFRTLANAIPQLCWMNDPEGWVLWFNRRWYEYTGTTPEQMEGWGWQSVHDPAALPAVMERWKRAIETGTIFDMVFPLRGGDGIYRPFLTRIVPVRDAEGRITRWFCTSTDISDQRRTEQALRASEERLRAVLENLQEGLVVTDPQHGTLAWNRAALRMHGFDWQNEDLKHLEDIRKVFEVRELDGTVLPFEEWPIRMAARGEEVRDMERILRNAQQDREWVFSYSGALVRDEAGQPSMSLLTIRDVTARKQAEDALAESEERFRVLADNISQLVWIADAGGERTWFNRRWYEYTGMTFEQVKGWNWWKVHHPDFLEAVLVRMNGAFASGQPLEMVYPLRGRDGGYRWFLGMVTPIRDAEGRTIRWFGTNTDITEQKLAEEQVRELNAKLEQRVKERTVQLEAANRELEAFSYSVSHDLRTPLRGIDGWSLALLEDYGDQLTPGARKYLERVRSETQRLGDLIDDLLQLARVTRAIMDRREVDLSGTAEAVAARLRDTNPKRKIEFAIEPGLRAPGDPRLLEVVLSNLLENAVKFTGPREVAHIEFGCSDDDGERVFFVGDNGVGFDMAFAGTLFGAFQRLHKVTEFPGTGVGLATVQRVINRHGGRVWAKAALGQGATFYFTVGTDS